MSFESPTRTADDATLRPSLDDSASPPPPRWVSIALPVILVLVYSDLSEALIQTFGVPSLLQPALVALAIVIWLHRRTLRPSRVLFHPITLTLLAFCALMFVSSIWADDPAISDAYVLKTMKNIFVYAIVAVLAASWRSLRQALGTLAITAAILAAISMAQIATGSRNELGGLATVVDANIYADEHDIRAAGPVGDANYYGQVLVMIIPLALVLANASTQKSRRLAWLAIAAIIIGGVLVTYSRGAMLAVAVMTGLVMLAMRVPVTRVAAGMVVALGLLVLMPGNIGRRFKTMVSLFPQETYYTAPDPSFERRKLIAATGALMFDHNLLLGVGADNFSIFFPRYSREAGSAAELFYDHGELEHPHSLYLEIASENGLLGLLVFGTLLAATFIALRTAHHTLVTRGVERRALLPIALGLALSGYLVTSVFLHGASQRYFFLVLGLVAALSCTVAGDAHRSAVSNGAKA
jgi:O-antigen ligase